MPESRQREIQNTKLYRPPVSADFVERKLMDGKLRAGLDMPLTVVLAPAGYGKSSTVSNWLETTGVAYAWLSLDEADNDLRLFLTCLISALRTVAGDICEGTLRSLQSDTLAPVDELATRLSNELGDLEDRLVLVLDDFHSIRSPEINALIDRLLVYPHPLLRLVVISRRDPPLSLVSLRARNAVMELRAADLGFSLDEAIRFFHATLDQEVDARIVERFWERTEGWPAGMRLISLALHGREDIDRLLDRFEANEKPLRDYLAAEVISALPADFRACLLNTSILDRFNASLVEALCNDSRATPPEGSPASMGQSFIERLNRHSLFTISLGGNPEWFRFHHLFGDLLRFHLGQSCSDDHIANLHRQACDWHTRKGYREDAIRHALAANETSAAISIVAHGRHELMNLDKWARLERWLKLFDESEIRRQPQLLMLRSWLALSFWHSMDTLSEDLDRIDTLLRHGAGDDGYLSTLRTEADVIRSSLCYWKMDAEQTARLAEPALQENPEEREYVRSIALMYRAGAHQLSGETAQGLSLLQEHLSKPGFDTPGTQARTLQALCFIHWSDADSRKLRQAATRLLEVSQSSDISWSLSYARYFLGIQAYESNDLDQAISHCEAIVTEPYLYPIQNVIHCSITLGLSFQAKGKGDAAREVADKVSQLTLQSGNSHFIQLGDGFQAELDLRQGFSARACRWAMDFELPPPQSLHRAFNPEFTLLRARLSGESVPDRQAASELLEFLDDTVNLCRHRRLSIDVLGLKAIHCLQDNDRIKAESLLLQALDLARPGRLVRPLLDQGKEIPRLLNELNLDDGGEQFLGRVFAAAQQSAGDADSVSNAPGLPEPLSQRELEILGLLADGLSNREIAERLFISPGTVKRHAHNIYGKLAVNDRRAAVGKAIRMGILIGH